MDKQRRQAEYEKIIKEELHLIQKKPGKKGTKANNLVGLSLSGGGIRSAAFAMGIVHGLVGQDRFKEIDYMTSVSGGGFTGSAITWSLMQNKAKGEEIVEKKGFILGQPYEGSRTSKVNDTLNYIRQHASYLTPGKGLNLISLFGAILRGIWIGIAVYFPPIALIIYLLQPWNLSNIYIGTTIGLTALFTMISLFFSLFIYFAYSSVFAKDDSVKGAIFAYQLRTACQKWLGRILTATALFTLLWSLKPVTELFHKYAVSGWGPAISTIIGYAGMMFKSSKSGANTNSQSSSLSKIIEIVGPMLLAYGLLLYAYQIAEFHSEYVWVGALCSLILGFFANVNLIGLHRIYQDRLMETFLPDAEAVKSQTWSIAKKANGAALHSMCDEETPGPYHILCGTVLLPNSTDPCVKGRGGDSFIMSPLYCGSFATGLQKTTDFMKGKLHLATAMAISGAAANPNGAESGSGPTRTPLVSFFMTLLNIRLGYWAPNPNHKRASKRGANPNFFFPGLQDLTGTGYHENSAFLELTDGVNFENLALYELIRRNVKVIIASDAGTDMERGFANLANAIEKVRVDFGVSINFTETESDLRWMMPGSGDVGPFSEKFGLSKQGYAVGTIQYPDNSVGKIYYLKPTLIDGLPADLYGYKSGNPTFPHQSTADQMFNEAQYEAYRELGYQLSTNLLTKLDKHWKYKA